MFRRCTTAPIRPTEESDEEEEEPLLLTQGQEQRSGATGSSASSCSRALPLHAPPECSAEPLSTAEHSEQAAAQSTGSLAGCSASSGQLHGQQQKQQDASPSTSGGKACSLQTALSMDTPVCRICLEEDDPSALETPCHCSGTQRWAHRRCLQRWIDEKHSTSCEICKHEYVGPYSAPPPPPPQQQLRHPADAALAGLPQLTPDERRALRHILSRLAAAGPGSPSRSAGPALHLVEMYGARAHIPSVAPQAEYEEDDDERRGRCPPLLIFLLLLMLLQGGGPGGGGAPAADAGAGAGGAAGGAGAGGAIPAPGADSAAADGGAGAMMVAGLTIGILFLAVWLLFVTLPLMLMRMLHGRQSEDPDAGSELSEWGASSPAPAVGSQQRGSRSDATAERTTGGRRVRHPLFLALHRHLQPEQGGSAGGDGSAPRLVGIV